MSDMDQYQRGKEDAMFERTELESIRQRAFDLAARPGLPTTWRVALTSLAMDAAALDALVAACKAATDQGEIEACPGGAG